MLPLRPFQREALSVLSKPGHLICVAPTGAGKSLIYERLAAERGLRLLMVSPLIALARQQAENLRKLKVRTALGAGSYSLSRYTEVPDARTGVWIVSPEMLHPDLAGTRADTLRKWKPDVLVVDECHCLWDWGWDFRPAFRQLPSLIQSHKIRRSLWLTATLPPDARRDLRSLLGKPLHELGDFRLPENLELSVARVPWPDRAQVLVRWILKQNGPGIIFVFSRESTLRVTRLLQSVGVNAAPYHAGMAQEERRTLELQVREKKIQVVVATNAFGMGMDFPHLTWAVLWQAAPSLLALAQAVGRIARSGAMGSALVLWDEEDFRSLGWLTRGQPRRERALSEVIEYFRGPGSPRTRLEKYFRSLDCR